MTNCVKCGKPMNYAHAGFYFGPDSPRHGNCELYKDALPGLERGDVVRVETGQGSFTAMIEDDPVAGAGGATVIRLVKVPEENSDE